MRLFKRVEQPTDADWDRMGGKPNVIYEGGLYKICHKDGTVVGSHKSVDSYGTVNLQ